ncbi:hypothetical protein GPECTOR_75g717 [Gonium pectorale]|uniref:CS domain-containing protein n=1 Tax=Gonium pectorale TaxID=33097 RepID=A0A150G2F0_GONPE|nr:hypothetical protein GPECTOR_75g717 [Gonium pectorale]|eukprot:KXZ43994.1 hypothetical protein GPECTOR_75g717 [Gonium pectorale]
MLLLVGVGVMELVGAEAGGRRCPRTASRQCRHSVSIVRVCLQEATTPGVKEGSGTGIVGLGRLAKAAGSPGAEALLDELAWCCCAAGDAMLYTLPPTAAPAASGGGVMAAAHDPAAALEAYRGAARLCPRSLVYEGRSRAACAILDADASLPRLPRRRSRPVLEALGLLAEHEAQRARYEVDAVLAFAADVSPSPSSSSYSTHGSVPPGFAAHAQAQPAQVRQPLSGPGRLAFRAAVARACGVPPASVFIERPAAAVTWPPASASAVRAARGTGSAMEASMESGAGDSIGGGGLTVWLTVKLGAGSGEDRGRSAESCAGSGRAGGGRSAADDDAVAVAAVAAAAVRGLRAPGAVAAAGASNRDRAEAVARLLQDPESALAGELLPFLGRLLPQHCTAQLRAAAAGSGGASPPSLGTAGLGPAAATETTEVEVMPSAPSRVLPLPFRAYRLVTAAGRPVERRRRHPFGLSRALYAAPELTPSLAGDAAVWAEPEGGGFRWRQSAGEVHLIATRVPHGLPASQLLVEVRPRSLIVTNRTTGEQYLSGTLEATVLADQATWVLGGGGATAAAGRGGGSGGGTGARHGGGARDGSGAGGAALTVTLVKMAPADGAASTGWWSRLFEGAPVVDWDEVGEKDYSTMPPELLEAHAREQARLDEAARRRRRRVGAGEGQAEEEEQE